MDDNIIAFDKKSDDEKVLAQIGKWIKESQTYHDYLLQRQNKAYEYYVGNQTDKDSIPVHLTNTVENRIYEGVETIVPIVTSSAHEFLVFPGSEAETSVNRANILEKVLSKKYRELEIQRKLEESTRDFLLYRFGCLKWGWDYKTDDIDVKKIDPRLILVPKLRCSPVELPYIMELQEYTPEEIDDYFPKIKKNELTTNETIGKGRGAKTDSKKTYQVIEIWTPEYVAWYSSGKMLERKTNPYFDFTGTKNDGKLKFTNYLDYPRMPYVFFTSYNVGDEPFGSISLVEAVIPIQDAINVQKRQIIDNLRRMGNGQLYIDSDAMTKEEADNITNEVGGIIFGEGVSSQNKVKRESGLPLPMAHFSNLMDSKASFDNIMGIHSATRGAGNAATATQDIMSRQQDLTRIDIITRVLNRGILSLAEGLTQLMKMFYTETHVVKILGEEDAVEFVRLNSDDIEEYIEIDVRTGKMPEMDKLQQANQAIQLWQLGAIDPITLYERLYFPNPEKMATRLLEYKSGMMLQELASKSAFSMAESKGQAAQEQGQELEANAPKRGVEMPANVMQRLTQGVGGTAPIESAPQV